MTWQNDSNCGHTATVLTEADLCIYGGLSSKNRHGGKLQTLGSRPQCNPLRSANASVNTYWLFSNGIISDADVR